MKRIRTSRLVSTALLRGPRIVAHVQASTILEPSLAPLDTG
jgi:hypothetical protein